MSSQGNVLTMALQLMVSTRIMSHDLVIPKSEHENTIRQLSSYQPGRYREFASPRIVDRQLKAAFACVQKHLMNCLLRKLHHLLRSNRINDWISTFVAMLALGMVEEEIQQMVHVLAETLSAMQASDMSGLTRDPEKVCHEIDERYAFLTELCCLRFSELSKVFRNRMLLDRVEGIGRPAHGVINAVADLISANCKSVLIFCCLPCPDKQLMHCRRLAYCAQQD